MKKIDRKILVRINQILGVVCLAAMFFSHLALTDIEESINELKYYRDKVFVPLV